MFIPPSILLCSCCECTCDTGTDFDDDYRCNDLTGFACIDPEAPCMDDDGVTIDMLEDCGSPISIRKTGGVAPLYIHL